MTPTLLPWIGIPAFLLHKYLPNSRRKDFKNGGHALPAHDFAEVIGEISHFLSP